MELVQNKAISKGNQHDEASSGGDEDDSRDELREVSKDVVRVARLGEVLIVGRVIFVGNASEETACNDTTSLDEQIEDALAEKDTDPEYPTVIMKAVGEFNDDPGGRAVNYTDYGGLAKDNLVRQEFNFSSDIGSEQLNNFEYPWQEESFR